VGRATPDALSRRARAGQCAGRSLYLDPDLDVGMETFCLLSIPLIFGVSSRRITMSSHCRVHGSCYRDLTSLLCDRRHWAVIFLSDTSFSGKIVAMSPAAF
jgi:hypothetical protein